MQHSPGIVPCQSCNELLHYSFSPSCSGDDGLPVACEVECLNVECQDFWFPEAPVGQTLAELSAKLGRYAARRSYVRTAHFGLSQD